jgi:hypothetical protein
MTFVPGFLNDVFISYTHLDDEPGAQNVQWVSQFRNHFESTLRQRLGSDAVSIFFDNSNLEAHRELAYLIENVRASAVLLPILSRAYIARPWTIKELDAFHGAAQGGHGIFASINRIVPIEILPFEENEKVAALLAGPKGMGIKRTRLYFEDQQTKIHHTLTPTNHESYWKRVAELAESCVKLLRGLKARAETGAAAQPAIQLQLQERTILLALPTDDLYDEAQQVRTYLEQFSVNVIPENDYPVGGADFAKAVRADLKRADLFVQLLSGSRSRIPFDLRQSENEPPQSYSCFQYEAAKRQRIPILQWHRPEINPETVTHYDKQLLVGPDVRVMGLQEFVKEVQQRFGEEVEKKRKEGEKHHDDGSFFFINAYPDDFELANTLAEAFKAHNRTAFLPMYKGLAKEKDEDIDENLINCDGLFLIFGEAPAHWVRAQLRRYIKVAGRRERTPRCKTILLAPGAQPEEVGVATNFEEIDCRNGAISDHIRKVVGELCPT